MTFPGSSDGPAADDKTQSTVADTTAGDSPAATEDVPGWTVHPDELAAHEAEMQQNTGTVDAEVAAIQNEAFAIQAEAAQIREYHHNED